MLLLKKKHFKASIF